MLKDKTFTKLKWFAAVALTPTITFFETVLPVWGVSDNVVHVITVTLGGLGTLIAGLLVTSNYNYKRSDEVKNEEL